MLAERFTRRDILKYLSAGTMVSLLGGCDRGRLPPGACTMHPVIDVHCHFFNASDVPVEGFVRYVVLGEDEPQIVLPRRKAMTQGMFDAFIVFLVLLLSQNAPSARTEAQRLTRREPLPSRPETDERKLDALANALIEFEQLARGARPSSDVMAEGFGATPDYDGLLDEFRATTDGRVAPFTTSAPLSATDARVTAQSLLEPGDFQRYLSFALLFLDFRETLAREYIRLFAQGGCISLMTPSFLDMEKWLAGKGPRSSIEEQVRVMDALQVRIADSEGVRMHSFVGFDPWREFEDGGALDRVKRAVTDHGFIGVKLYPPMGFRAWRNEGLDELPERFNPNDLPRLIRALRELYDWCLAEEVPILAHAENSLGPNCKYGKRASPEWWRHLLATGNYSNLRVNLAHFGSFDEILKLGKAPTSRSCPEDAYEGPAWETIIGQTVHDEGRRHLYADLSYFHELVAPETGAEQRQRIRDLLNAYKKAYDRDVRHLLFGTDWTMIAQEPEHNNYLSRMNTELAAAGFTPEQRENVFWKNAVRYLGLGRGGKARQRISVYCRDRGLETEWLDAYDAA